MSQDLPTDDGIGFTVPGLLSAIEEIKATYWPIIRAKGDSIIVKPYVRPEKIGSLYVAGAYRAEDPFQTQVGQVIDVGPLAYANKDITGGLIWCKVGDWVMFSRIAGSLIFKKGSTESESIPFRRIRGNEVDSITSDPENWIMGIPKQF